MSEYVKTSVHVNEVKIQQKVENLINEDVMREIHQLLMEFCDPYVPYDTGELSDQDKNVIVDSQAVTYTKKYAARQYYGTEFNHTTEHHPKATALWDSVMMSEQGEVFIQKVKEILGRRAKELYG